MSDNFLTVSEIVVEFGGVASTMAAIAEFFVTIISKGSSSAIRSVGKLT
jgi:hypothetical protein